MYFKPFKKLIDDFHKKKEAQEYDGFVEDNNDPKKLGRIKVRTELYEDVELDALPWCYPTPSFFLGNSKNSICFSVPEIGSQVKVYYPTKDKTVPFYKGMEFNQKNKCTFFDIDYPNSYGFKDSRGNFYIVDKATDITQYQHSSGTNIKIESDGTYTITTPDGSYIQSDCNGNMRMCGTTLTVNMTESIKMNAPEITTTGLETNTVCGAVVNVNGTDVLKEYAPAIELNADTVVQNKAPRVWAEGQLGTSSGATGVFATISGNIVSVVDGIITSLHGL